MNRCQVRFLVLFGVAALAAPAFGQAPDHVAACYASFTDVRLSNLEGIVLNQNSPNPFAQQTTITYKLPDNLKKAQMVFYDAHGDLIKAVDIASPSGRSDQGDHEDPQCTGRRQVFVFADDLSEGTYKYSIVVDGRVAASKWMVKSK